MKVRLYVIIFSWLKNIFWSSSYQKELLVPDFHITVNNIKNIVIVIIFIITIVNISSSCSSIIMIILIFILTIKVLFLTLF